MSEIDKMAREMLGGEYKKANAVNPKCNFCTDTWDVAIAATRAALLAAPPGWKLVPVQPTDEMIDSAEDAHMPFGDMHFAITSAILAAPEPK